MPPMTPVTAELIEAPIAARVRQLLGYEVDVNVVAHTASTNTDLLGMARQHAPLRPRIRVALEQSAGRGRLGRQWLAPAGSAVLLSVARRLHGNAVTSAVTLACGVAVAETLRAAGIAAELKWPNDVLLRGRKLAGLLSELAIDGANARTLVVGLGLNLIRADTLPRDAAALNDAITVDDVSALHATWSARLAAAVLDAAASADRDGFTAFEPRFNALFAWRGRPVCLLDHGGRVARGVALGVDTHGQLLLDVNGTASAHASGEVSLRIAANTDVE